MASCPPPVYQVRWGSTVGNVTPCVSGTTSRRLSQGMGFTIIDHQRIVFQWAFKANAETHW
jgi:hypothetical protein